MTYAEFLRQCLAEDARRTVLPARDLARQVLERVRGPTAPGPPI